MIKLVAGHRDAGGGISHTPGGRSSLWRRRAWTSHCSIVGSSSSVVEPSRWWTYAALMHVIITFISWRWHMTSSGPHALTGARKSCLFLFSLLFFFSFNCRTVQGCWWEALRVINTPSTCTSTPSGCSSSSLPPPPSIKVNKGLQQRANEHGPLSRDACLCCLPPRTPLVYLGCQVKGRLGEGETFFCCCCLIRPFWFL